jgi:type II secretory pathway pseudopilin PulG
VLIVVSIIVILASIGGTYAFRAWEDAKVSEAQIKANAIGGAVQRFMVRYERFPNDLSELAHPPSGQPFMDQDGLTDPWGKPFQYIPPPSPHNGENKPDVFTTTPHGEQVGNWKQ